MSKIAIISGFAGTVGIPITLRFLKEGYNVIGIDSFVYSAAGKNYDMLVDMIDVEKFRCLELDVQNLTLSDIAAMLKDINSKDFGGLHDIDCVIHLASPASPISYKQMPEYTIESNVEGTKRMLEVADLFEARKFLFASTSEVYGKLNKEYFVEEDVGLVNSWGDRSCYDVSKMCGEALVKAYKQRHSDVSAGIVRIFNTYSEWGAPNDGRVVNNFVRNMILNKEIVLHNDGKPTRSFQYVQDLVDGIWKYTQSNLIKPINLGNPNEYYSVYELAWIIRDVLDKTFGWDVESFTRYQTEPQDPDDPPVRRPDITKAKELLGWEPKISLRRGLIPVIERYINLYKLNPALLE